MAHVKKRVATLVVVLIGLAACSGNDEDVIELGLGGTSGQAEIERTPSGWRIELDAELPRRDNGEWYEAFLEGEDGRVSVGTFNEADDVVLWAGVSPETHPTFVIVEQPSGNVVDETDVSEAVDQG